MNIGGLNIPAERAARGPTVQQNHTAPLTATKNRQSSVSLPTDRYRTASDAIIEAEYVDLYSPIRRPPEQQNQWRHLIIEGQSSAPEQGAKPAADKYSQQLIARYGQHSSDFPLPGSFVNLFA